MLHTSKYPLRRSGRSEMVREAPSRTPDGGESNGRREEIEDVQAEFSAEDGGGSGGRRRQGSGAADSERRGERPGQPPPRGCGSPRPCGCEGSGPREPRRGVGGPTKNDERSPARPPP